ncbi:glycoside hydrolase [Hesseltinella vesiculosa]|uniref:glucan 1,3-beta-glucosidase n=1 Tax=Hesseltinella vesiculosa TaxID=101127 RepID=A0A1X2GBP4_9FUNG|nr:glycoside hydrolase [Hesseltinella vesiculosa]
MPLTKRFLDDQTIFSEKLFDNGARVNDKTLPLDKPFDYGGKTKIRGVNLGGWLVTEPFITPKLFEEFPLSDNVIDEWSLCAKLGPEKAKERLEKHYDSFVKEEDFKKIASMGLNHVRIPLGHWAVRVFEGEPFVPYVSFKYLLRGVQWARKYGLRVMVELHTAPGSQNGWNHSGRTGTVGFLNGTMGREHADQTLKIIEELVDFFSAPEWAPAAPLFGVLNEPAIYRLDHKELARDWYEASYKTLRKDNPSGPWLTYHEGFLGLGPWKGFFNDPQKHYDRVIVETHTYLIFDATLVSKPKDEQALFPCTGWLPDLSKSMNETGPIMVGEFSVATNDCGKFLNGVGLGTRYEGTLSINGELQKAVCKNCTCPTEDWHKFDKDTKLFLAKFAQRQMDAFERTYGWFFWTYKTEDHVNPHWDYLLGYEQGWMPKDASAPPYNCRTK